MIRLVSMLRTARSRQIALVGLAAMVALWAGPGLAAPDIRAGQALARVHCAECHAIGHSGRSTRPAATPFRLIQQRYPVEALEEAFGEGITGSHKGMPDFAFSPRQVDDLLGYIKSLGRRR